MRTNLPVSGAEYRIDDNATLMSTTDLDSRVTYCNAAFLEASGFDRRELMGQPHNAVRHPDMPAQAFADMWRTLKSGVSWTALVKNRRRNGDHYWVRANATPVHRDGRLAGYMSVRTTPTRAEVASAETLYRQMREGRAGRRRLHRGIVVRTGWMAWASWMQRMPVAWRIDAALVLFGASCVGMAAAVGLGAAPLGELAVGVVACGLCAGLALRRQVSRPLGTVLKQAQAVAAGQPSRNVNLDRVDEIGLILRAINQAGLNLRSLVDDVSEQVGGLKTASGEIAQGNSDLSVRTEQAAASLQETAASMEQMTATLTQNAATARQTTTIASEASAAAGHGRDAVSQVVDTMRLITDSSRRIAEIIGVIDGIAFQTNILALNAAVEAARAGEQGRGFAVVAAEVRTLAHRSADAAKEIKTLIADSVEKVERGSAVAEVAGNSIQHLVTQVSRVSDLIAQINTSTIEQSTGIAQVNVAVAQLDQVTQQNAALVEQSAAAAESMKMQTVRLAEAVGVYRSH